MLIDMSKRPELSAEIEACCLALFDRWCEKRRVVPLAYLMHAWPIPKPTPTLMRHLSRSLHDLMLSYSDSLDVDECRLIEDAIAIAEENCRA
ncbi:hypothetical protein P3T22_005001 [Paraburkholderia sp. GAS348]|uniref:Uncharacterized protein n=1 Tax=Paraburkholderia phytofirmans OLGA172 TaxID=1417228 RepID=A0A160FRJ2_9BURK|nr:hypothetical protein [Paraburkholderia phytofirmans]ANB75630.1 hypothetical protein AYM40_25135 [Paraburkholderia phytofirmans OLGA172]